MKLAIVVADFNSKITSRMLTAAERTAKEHSITYEVIHVPGAFEAPFAVQQLLKRGKTTAVVTLGAVIQGDTHHDIIICDNVSRKLMDLSLEYDIPVSLSIIGPRVTWEQASERAEDYAEHGVESMLRMLEVKKCMNPS